MPRKLSAVLDYKLRITEALRRRIEQAAKSNGVSYNREMVDRLERSFENETLLDLNRIIAEAKEIFGKLDWDAYRQANVQHELMHAAIRLALQVKQLPDEYKNYPPIKAAIARIEGASRLAGATESMWEEI